MTYNLGDKVFFSLLIIKNDREKIIKLPFFPLFIIFFCNKNLGWRNGSPNPPNLENTYRGIYIYLTPRRGVETQKCYLLDARPCLVLPSVIVMNIIKPQTSTTCHLH